MKFPISKEAMNVYQKKKAAEGKTPMTPAGHGKCDKCGAECSSCSK